MLLLLLLLLLLSLLLLALLQLRDHDQAWNFRQCLQPPLHNCHPKPEPLRWREAETDQRLALAKQTSAELIVGQSVESAEMGQLLFQLGEQQRQQGWVLLLLLSL
jgi:hypothetical protein